MDYRESAWKQIKVIEWQYGSQNICQDVDYGKFDRKRSKGTLKPNLLQEI